MEADREERRVEHGHELNEFASDDQEPSQKLVTAEHQQLLWESFEALPEKYREPLVLFYRHHKNTAEVAQALDLSDATVRKRLERGRAMLRNKVASLVEDLLSDSVPSPVFTAAVLAMLPVLSAQAAAAATGSGFALGTIGTKIAAACAFVIGPLIGMIGGLLGGSHSLRDFRSLRKLRKSARNLDW